MNLILPYFSVFCSQLCFPLVLMQPLGMPDHCLLTDLDRICWLPNPEGWMKCRDFIWGRVRKREKIIHKIHTTPNTLYIFTAQLRDCNSFPISLCNSSQRPRTLCTGAEGGIGQCTLPLLKEKTGFIYIVKEVRGEKKHYWSQGIFCHKAPMLNLAVMKDVPDLCSAQSLCYHECPNTESRQQTMSKPLQILVKGLKPTQKQLVKMEGDKMSKDLAHEHMGLPGVKENNSSFVCDIW